MQYFTRKQVVRMIQVGIHEFGLAGFSDGTGITYKTLQNIVNGETKTITEKVASRLGLEVVYRKNRQEAAARSRRMGGRRDSPPKERNTSRKVQTNDN